MIKPYPQVRRLWCSPRYRESVGNRTYQVKKKMKSFSIILLMLISLCLATSAAYARNYPCSGSKGGISHCRGETFICNDGSVSGSKQSCSAVHGHGNSSALGFVSRSSKRPELKDGSSCSCRSGSYCTGPRGGRYCYNDSGNKSYLRR